MAYRRERSPTLSVIDAFSSTRVRQGACALIHRHGKHERGIRGVGERGVDLVFEESDKARVVWNAGIQTHTIYGAQNQFAQQWSDRDSSAPCPTSGSRVHKPRG